MALFTFRVGSATIQAQGQGAISNLRLSSAGPGELTISWDLADPAPSYYRISWADERLGFLPYEYPDEATRGNEHPGSAETWITLTGLTKGANFKVVARARYLSRGSRWRGL